MSDHHQPPGTPAPDDQTLLRMRREFPGHRIWREILPGRTRYVARRTRPGPGPHTIVTPDLAELAAALTARQPPASPGRTAPDD